MNSPFLTTHLQLHNHTASSKPNYIKIKYVIWINAGVKEIVNTWAIVKRHNKHYRLFFDDCISADDHALFDSKKRVFYSD